MGDRSGAADQPVRRPDQPVRGGDAGGGRPRPFEPGRPIGLEPLSLRVFRGHAEAPKKPAARASRAARDAAEQRLFALARDRVVIERVEPELDGGRHPIKRVVGDVIEVEADIFCDGHDQIAACIQYRARDENAWRESAMALVENDRWAGRFPVMRNRRYVYTIEAWRDLFESWRAEVMKKHDAGLDVALELTEGRMLRRAHARAGQGRRSEGAESAARAARAPRATIRGGCCRSCSARTCAR